MFKRLAFYLGVLCVVLIAARTLSAQVGGRLTGSVVDQSGAAVPGAIIKLYLPGGNAAVLSSATTGSGVFTLSGLRPEFYDVVIEANGFRKQTLRAVKVDAGRETSLAALKLEVGTLTEVIEVPETNQGVQTSNAEVSTSVTSDQVRRLPLLDRSPQALIATKAGVTYNGRGGGSTVNGLRISYANVTVDGINVQDNFLRGSALDYNPTRMNLDQVAEMTIATSNTNASVGGGAAQVVQVTPSGQNDYHGATYWYNRNNALAASDWFANKNRISKPFLNQNQAGFSIGGPILKNKVLFYANYEAYRKRQQVVSNRTILTEDARKGIFTYMGLGGAVQKVNLLQVANEQVDPAIQQLLSKVPTGDKINNFDTGDSLPSLMRNTAGYSFNSSYNANRDNFLGKVDLYPSEKHVFTATYSWNRDIADRPTAGISNPYSLANDYSINPKVKNDADRKLLVAAWRWNPVPSFTNEARGGLHDGPARFTTSETFGDYLLTNLLFDNPVNTFRDQGRYTDTYNYMDNANWISGRHSIQFGYQAQQIRTEVYDDAGNLPTYVIGTGQRTGIASKDLPGVGASDLIAANRLLATLAGYLESASQTFNITSRDSGFVSGAPNRRRLRLDNHALYFQDKFKLSGRVTLNFGVRYDYFTPVDERDSLYLMPVLTNNSAVQTLLSNSTLDFAGGSAGRPWYNKDKNNFAPNIGIAYDPFGNGKTAIRAGYSISYVNDETIRALDYNLGTNAGLSARSSKLALTGKVSSGMHPLPVPAFKVPLQFSDNYRNDRNAAFSMPDPNLRTPYVQQWNLAIQHDFSGTVVEVRYTGNHAVKQFRAFDYNQVVVKENGFLDDFLRAQNNGFLAEAKTGSFNPSYNPAIAGSQALTLFPLMANSGYLNTATVASYIKTGQIGDLANYYQTRGYNGPVNFYRNPYALAANCLTNYSNSSYNALVLDVKRRMKRGLQVEGSYVYSKNLSDAAGDGQTRLESFLDIANTEIERARTPYDLSHAIKANGIWNLPMGRGHALNSGPMRFLLSGWSVSGWLTWQSGAPFSVLSSRATLNRSGGSRSLQNTANTSLTKSELDQLFQFRQTGDGPYFVAAPVINPADGRAVAADGKDPFSGQVFFQPGAGTIGALQRRLLSGPWTFTLDAGIQKNTYITERQSVEFRMESTNVLNHPTWYLDDQTISSAQFGRITSNLYGSRVVQMGLYYRF